MKSMYEFMSQFDMSMFTLPGPKEGEKVEKEFYPAKNCNFERREEKNGIVSVKWTNRKGELPVKALDEPVLMKYVWDQDRYRCTGKCYPVKSSGKEEQISDES